MMIEKFTQPEEIDLDESEKALLETFNRNEGNSLKILLGIYKGHYVKLFFSILKSLIRNCLTGMRISPAT